jgi:signal transduction histidine kinase
LRPRTLGHRLTLANAMIIGAVVGLSAVAISGLFALGHDISMAVAEYEEIRIFNKADVRMERVMVELAAAQDPKAITQDMQAARDSAEAIIAFHSQGGGETDDDDAPGQTEHDLDDATTLSHALGGAIAVINAADPASASFASTCRSVHDSLVPARQLLSKMAMENDLNKIHRAAGRRARVSVITVGALSLFIVAAAIVVAVRVHRRVVGSVRDLQGAVRKIAGGRFTERLEERGDREIVELARDFNRMAIELDSLYRMMEQRVQEKSRELVRSERLASVGFLAAGVAHEINNPLSIIDGYATLSRKWLAGSPSQVQVKESRDALEIIQSEAFRCKEIVEQLQTLSFTKSGRRGPVSLKFVVRDLVSLVAGLERREGRRVLFDNPNVEDITVSANSAELKQVVLNLIVNALAATDPKRGEVRISIGRSNGHARLTVADNGRGLEPEMIEKVFEPFFSHHAEGEKGGLGLGLTISHAIVEAHGGRLVAQSDGLGKGCRFTVDLPALVAEGAAP